jgi:peptide deformylase
MKLPLAYYGDPVLRKKTAPVLEIDDKIRQLVADMAETMDANDGCGLAAPQVHQSLALFITSIPQYIDERTVLPGQLRVFINPRIVAYSEEMWPDREACLSIPGICESVLRPLTIKLEATNLEGEAIEEEFTGYDAHVIMHENDHINGVLFIDRLPPRTKKEIEGILRKIKKEYSKG